MSMTTYNAKPGAPVRPEHPEIPHPEHPEEPQPVEMPTDMRAPALAVPSTEPIPEVAPSAPPATLGTPPVILSTSEPSPLPESRIAISISEQIQHHQGILSTLEHAIPIPSEPTDPSQALPLVEQTMHPEEPSTGEIEASILSIPTSTVEPSSSHDPPTTI
ncbi:hypothetical protein CK203_054425 [Vitis vinifera]|uniref:Uncharacterized protein n=1 Tax=Vitis vinifera TaxID=29760 RepID=A0A438GZX5_VITVI|nr:hypothetical protein CK203_054425 [Vitis vinifera]